MKSRVYFISVSNFETADSVKAKLAQLLEVSRLLDFIRKGDTVAVKLHFGEEGNTGYLRPEYVRVVVDKVKERQARPILTDTNTLYRGRRMDSKSHLQLAYEHGFRPEITGAEVLIPDDTQREEVAINQKFIKVAKIASFFPQAQAILSLAHFKGHMMTGFAGALKNLGMGCASREGKLAQHSDISPFVKIKKCVGCGECEKVCPVKAATVRDNKSYIDNSKCIGCASCIAACVYNAIDVRWESGADNIQQKMVEYAKAALSGKGGRAAFINFALKITKECDCMAKDDPRIAPDIGVFASLDPVSIDRASADMVQKACGRDVFKEMHPERDGFRQLKYASQIGLGNLDYELIQV
jgi:uncharacterized Fe-S center protein